MADWCHCTKQERTAEYHQATWGLCIGNTRGLQKVHSNVFILIKRWRALYGSFLFLWVLPLRDWKQTVEISKKSGTTVGWERLQEIAIKCILTLLAKEDPPNKVRSYLKGGTEVVEQLSLEWTFAYTWKPLCGGYGCVWAGDCIA